ARGSTTRRLAAALVVVAAIFGTVKLAKRKVRHAVALVTPAPRPAPAAPDLAQRLGKIEEWLAQGSNGAARRAPEEATDERPKDGRVRYMLGRVAYADDRHAEALGHYREAIALDAGFRGDPVLLAHLDAMLSESKQADAALDLVVDKVGAPAADLLEKVANE